MIVEQDGSRFGDRQTAPSLLSHHLPCALSHVHPKQGAGIDSSTERIQGQLVHPSEDLRLEWSEPTAFDWGVPRPRESPF